MRFEAGVRGAEKIRKMKIGGGDAREGKKLSFLGG